MASVEEILLQEMERLSEEDGARASTLPIRTHRRSGRPRPSHVQESLHLSF
jgi:hypothetical protein